MLKKFKDQSIRIFRFLQFSKPWMKLCAAHIGMDGIRIEKEPRQRDEYVNTIS